ncbi:hypothetical protein N0V90_000548 [Kalmusia sp. IMI 367209]|nr:hypothetical protein N0V90_000548 [Kalmusia sp. IMI 367209]
MVHHFDIVALLAINSITTTFAQTTTSPIVDLGYAKYRGHHNDTLNINEFHSLRFANPPTGSLRWKAPQPYSPQNLTGNILDATQSGSPCIQGFPQWTISGPVQAIGSEDCLFIDIFVPANVTKGDKLPVALTIPGGGYVMGYAGQSSPYALMNHSNNAFIFIAMQYRLGAYGFLGSEKYAKEGGAANVGLLDQRLAMEWVQDHVEAFGGDPAKVTILGGSAGGGSVTSQLIWKGGAENPPFRAAMADFPWWQQYQREEQLTKQYEYLLASANCSTLVCLQGLSEERLQEATQATYISAYADEAYGYGNFYYGPYVDGDLIRGLPSQEFRAGHFAKVPLWTSREGYEGFTFSNQSMTSLEEETEDLRIQFPYAKESFIDDIFKLYPRQAFNSTFWQRLTWFGDFSINCPTYYVASSLANAKVPVYKQIFNVGTQKHGATGPYLSDLDYASEPGANVSLANALRDWWASFVVHNDPNAQGWSDNTKPIWPAYATNGEVMSVNFTEIGAVRDMYYDDSERCQFFWANEEVSLDPLSDQTEPTLVQPSSSQLATSAAMNSKRKRIGDPGEEQETLVYASEVPWLRCLTDKSGGQTSCDEIKDDDANKDLIWEACRLVYLLYHNLHEDSNLPSILEDLNRSHIQTSTELTKAAKLHQSQWKTHILNKYLMPHISEIMRKWHVAHPYASFDSLSDTERVKLWMDVYDADPRATITAMYRPVIKVLDVPHIFDRNSISDADVAKMKAIQVMFRRKYCFGCESTYRYRIKPPDNKNKCFDDWMNYAKIGGHASDIVPFGNLPISPKGPYLDNDLWSEFNADITATPELNFSPTLSPTVSSILPAEKPDSLEKYFDSSQSLPTLFVPSMVTSSHRSQKPTRLAELFGTPPQDLPSSAAPAAIASSSAAMSEETDEETL